MRAQGCGRVGVWGDGEGDRTGAYRDGERGQCSSIQGKGQSLECAGTAFESTRMGTASLWLGHEDRIVPSLGI